MSDDKNFLEEISSIYSQKKEIDSYLRSHGNSNYLFDSEEYSDEFCKLYPTDNYSAIPFKRLYYIDANGILKENNDNKNLFGFELKCHDDSENAEPDDITYFHPDDFKYLFRNNQGLSSFYIKGIFCFSQFFHTFENCRNLKYVTIDAKFLQAFNRTFAIGHVGFNDAKTNYSSIRRTTVYGYDSSLLGNYDCIESDKSQTIKFDVSAIFDNTSFSGCDSLEIISFPQQTWLDLTDIGIFYQLSSILNDSSHQITISCKNGSYKLPNDWNKLNSIIDSAKEVLAINNYNQEISTDYYRIKNHKVVGLTENGLNYFNRVDTIAFPSVIKNITVSNLSVDGWEREQTTFQRYIPKQYNLQILHSNSKIFSIYSPNKQVKITNTERIKLGENFGSCELLLINEGNFVIAYTSDSDQNKYPFCIADAKIGTQYIDYEINGGFCDFKNSKTFMDDYFNYYNLNYSNVANKHFIIPINWKFDFMPFEFYKQPFKLTIEFESGTKTINTGCVIGTIEDGKIYQNFDLKKNLEINFIIPKSVKYISNKMIWSKIADNVTFTFKGRTFEDVKEVAGYPFVFEGTYLYHLKNSYAYFNYLKFKNYSKVHYLTIDTSNKTMKIPVDVTVNNLNPLVIANCEEYNNSIKNLNFCWVHSLNEYLKTILGFTDIET